jgi:fibronectin type 3 domain-containing protein
LFSFAHAQVSALLPSVPTGLTATANLPSQIALSWTASTESSGTIAGYNIYRNGIELASTADTSLLDSNLQPGVYTYTVAAYDTAGNLSNQSVSASAMLVSDTTPPSAPTNVTVTGVTSTNYAYNQIPVTVSWTASTDNVGVTGYRVYRNGISMQSNTSTPLTGTSISDIVFPGTTSYTVSAYDASQNVSDRSAPGSITIIVDTTPPSMPWNLKAQQTGAGTVNLTWASSTDNVGVVGYQVFRTGMQIATTTDPSYVDTTVSAGYSYSYAVTAFDLAGNISAQSATTQVTVQAVNGVGTPAFTSLIQGTSKVNLSWGVPADALAITGYTIYRNGTQLAVVTSTNYVDQGLGWGNFAYSLSATDSSGATSQTSSSTTVTLPAVHAVVPITVSSTLISPTVSTTSTISGASVGTLSQFLYFGLRNAQVQILQSALVGQGYLAPLYATGFFGNLTLHALQKFQCDHKIVCVGGPGYGTVGPKTRNAFNTLSVIGNH